MFERYVGVAVALLFLLAGAGVAVGQEAGQEQLLSPPGESPQSRDVSQVSAPIGQVVYTLDQMPHVPTRSLEQMSAGRIQPPSALTREELVRQGLLAAEALRALDSRLRQEKSTPEDGAGQAVGGEDPVGELIADELESAGTIE